MRTLKKNILALILARVTAATALLIAAVVIQFSTVSFLPLTEFYVLLLGSYVLTLIYLVLYFFNRNFRAQAHFQIISDLLWITAVVYISGGIAGNLYFLYVFAIIAASLLISDRGAYVTAALASVLFGTLADGMFYGLIPYFREDQGRNLSLGPVLYSIFLAWALFFAIAVMVNYLARTLDRTRAALAGAKRELELKERQAVVGRTSAQIAHEIRNPLAAISGAVQVLKGELALSAEQERLMDIVIGESKRISASIDQFLSLASPRRQEFRTFDVAEVLRETLTMLRMSGELNGRHSVLGNFETIRIPFHGNPGLFKQIFWNLTRNALRAMSDGGNLTVDLAAENPNRLTLRFRDTGTGMTEAEIEKIFEPFYSGFEGGQGLGMTVVRNIIDDLGGRIDVASEPGRGTEIEITLPVTREGA